jgi:hypothetical protein
MEILFIPSAYLGNNIFATPEQLMNSDSLRKEMSGGSSSVIGSTYCINKGVSFQRSNDVYHRAYM